MSVTYIRTYNVECSGVNAITSKAYSLARPRIVKQTNEVKTDVPALKVNVYLILCVLYVW